MTTSLLSEDLNCSLSHSKLHHCHTLRNIFLPHHPPTFASFLGPSHHQTFPFPVSLNANMSDNIHSDQQAVAHFVPPGGRRLTPFNEVFKKLVTCNNLSQLTDSEARLDCFQAVRHEHPNFKDRMLLDPFQLSVAGMMTSAPGGVQLFEGCTGTGKKHLSAEIDKVFADHETHFCPVVHACPSTENANVLATRLADRLGDSCRVVRLYSRGTEN